MRPLVIAAALVATVGFLAACSAERNVIAPTPTAPTPVALTFQDVTCDPQGAPVAEGLTVQPGDAIAFVLCDSVTPDSPIPDPVFINRGQPEFGPLEAALSLPSEPAKPDQPCPLMAEVFHPTYVQTTDGAWYLVRVPTDACGFTLPEAGRVISSTESNTPMGA